MRNIRKKIKSLHIWKRQQTILWFRESNISKYAQGLFTYGIYSGNKGHHSSN